LTNRESASEGLSVAWFDGLLLSALPVFIVMSILAVLVPWLRSSGSWRGIGAAWLAAFVVALLIAVTHPNEWALSCNWPLIRTGVTGVAAINPDGPCSGTNALSSWLVALPPLSGIAVLLAWVGRNSGPLPATMRTVGALTAMAVAIVALAQVSQAVALLFVVAVGLAAYAWPRLKLNRAT
jgi:hypothetical protein